MALDIWLDKRLQQLNWMLGTQPTSLLWNRDLDRMLSVIWANKAVPQKAPIVNMNNSWHAVPWAVSSTVPLTATSVTQPQYISNAFTPQWLSWSFLTASQSTADLFNDYEKAINPYLQDYNKNSFALWNDVLSQLNQQKNNYMSQFWPQWTIQTQLDDYYKWLWQYLWSQQAANQALQSNEALRATWSSAAAWIAWNKVAEDYLNKVNEANKQRLAEQTNIYQQLNNYMNQFTTQYANTKDKYVLDTYKRLFDFKNQLAWQILQQQNALVNAQLTKANTPWTWTATPAKTATVPTKAAATTNIPMSTIAKQIISTPWVKITPANSVYIPKPYNKQTQSWVDAIKKYLQSLWK